MIRMVPISQYGETIAEAAAAELTALFRWITAEGTVDNMIGIVSLIGTGLEGAYIGGLANERGLADRGMLEKLFCRPAGALVGMSLLGIGIAKAQNAFGLLGRTSVLAGAGMAIGGMALASFVI